MRTELRRLWKSKGRKVFTAAVGLRISPNPLERVLVDIKDRDGTIYIDHLIISIGRNVAKNPETYGMLVPTAIVTFIAEATEYVRRKDGTLDYGLNIVDVLKVEKGSQELIYI